MSSTAAPAGVDLAGAREHFLSLIDSVRPDLHRYVSRLVGSAIDGEDVVQDTLAKAFYALSLTPDQPPLRPWLFRIAKNTAIDFLRRYERRNVDGALEVDTMTNDVERDPEVIRAAVHTFMTLPISQRSAVIMKDVLDESLEDIADHLGTTVGAVKSLLVRGRQALKKHAAEDSTATAAPVAAQPAEHRALVQRYIALFNQKDWVGVQSLLLEEVKLDLVSKSQRQGKAVGLYFGRYAKDPDVSLRSGSCEGRACIGVFRGAASTPESLVFLESEGGRVSFIRDYRYVPYLVSQLEFVVDAD